jgi:hypothetical protein
MDCICQRRDPIASMPLRLLFSVTAFSLQPTFLDTFPKGKIEGDETEHHRGHGPAHPDKSSGRVGRDAKDALGSL